MLSINYSTDNISFVSEMNIDPQSLHYFNNSREILEFVQQGKISESRWIVGRCLEPLQTKTHFTF